MKLKDFKRMYLKNSLGKKIRFEYILSNRMKKVLCFVKTKFGSRKRITKSSFKTPFKDQEFSR